MSKRITRKVIIKALLSGSKDIATLAKDLNCHWSDLSSWLEEMESNSDITLLDDNSIELIIV